MRRKLAAVLVIAGLSFGTAYFVADQRVEQATVYANHVMYENLEEMMNDEKIIAVVTGHPVGKRNNILVGDRLPTGYTLTDFQIDQVIKNSSGDELEQKQLVVREPYFINEKGIEPGKIKVSYEHYSEMKNGSKYLLFLAWHKGSNTYAVHGLYQGKVNLDGTDIEEEKYIRNTNAQGIKEEALKKFK